MIKERYCSFEVSKLLEEKCFDGLCDYYYPKDGGEIEMLDLDELNYEREKFIEAPTHQMACDWLEEKYHINIEVMAYPHEDDCFYWAYRIMELRHTDTDLGYYKVGSKAGFESKKDAIEESLKECLTNLI